MAQQPVYKVIFQNGNEVVEVYARQIFQSDLWGFIEIEEFVDPHGLKIMMAEWTRRRVPAQRLWTMLNTEIWLRTYFRDQIDVNILQ